MRSDNSVLFGDWLETARAQGRATGVDYRDLACYARKLTPYVEHELFVAARGLEQMYIRIPPGPLDEETLRGMWEDHRSDYIRNLRGVLDHLALALAAVGCSSEELADAGMPEVPQKIADEASEKAPEDSVPAAEETIEVKIPVPLNKKSAELKK